MRDEAGLSKACFPATVWDLMEIHQLRYFVAVAE
jgi:hypothetical protein